MWIFRAPNRRMFLDWRGYLIGAGLVILATLLKYLAQPDIITNPNSLLYILAIVITATYFGFGPAIFASVLSVVIYDFFFVVPYNSFSFPGPQVMITLTIFLLVGVVVSFLASVLRSRTDEAIKANEELQLRATILDKAKDAILLCDQFYHILYVNEAASEMYGYRKDEFTGMNFNSLIPTSDFSSHQEKCKELQSDEEMCTESDHIRKDGSAVPVEMHSHHLKIGSQEYIVSIIRDISRRRQAQLKLQESEEKYRLLVENATEVIAIVQDGVVKFFGGKAFELTGYLPEEAVSQSFLQFVFPDDRDRASEIYRKYMMDESVPPNNEFRTLRKDGTVRWSQLNAVKINWEKGPAVLAIFTDVTERKSMEQALKDYAQKITRVQEEERKRIAYELHDDTAQYLSILKLQLDSLVQSGKIQDPEIMEKLRFLEKDADRAFQDVRRYSHELRPGVLEHLGLQAAMEQIADDINKLAQITVEVNIEGEEPEISEDVKLGFFRIAQEALNNSRKHAKGSRATIRLQFLENRVKMTVSDNGAGFDMKEALNRTSLKGNLGLTSMQERAKLIGANLQIDSKPGAGTIVTVEMVY
jgi:PAS domain S-box-containing protein